MKISLRKLKEGWMPFRERLIRFLAVTGRTDISYEEYQEGDASIEDMQNELERSTRESQ